SDLRKTKGFSVSLSWKKKKKRDPSEEVMDHISEHEEFDNQVETKQKQVGFQAAEPTPEPSCTSDQSQPQDIMSDMSEEDAGFMPSNLDGTSMPYIDSPLSESDSYETPPDSPAADKFVHDSISESKMIDSFNSVPNLETAASTDICTVHNSNTDLNPSGVSFRDDHPFSDFETSKDVELNTINLDVTLNEDKMVFQSHLERKDSKDSAVLSIHQSSTDSIHETSASCIPQSSQSSISSIPQSSISSIPQSFGSHIPHSSTSILLDGFTSNNTVTQTSSSNSYSADTLPEHSSSLPSYIISTEVEDSQTKNMSASNSDLVNTDPSNADTASSMPDVIVSSTASSSRITESSLDADTDRKPILSLSNTDVSGGDLSFTPQSLSTITIHSTSDSSLLKETHPEIHCETVSMESYETNNHSSLTYATDSEKPSPAQPVLLENESNISLPQSALWRTYTNESTVTFDLSGPTDPIRLDHSQRGLSDNMSYSDMETRTEIPEHNQINPENDQAISTNRSETSECAISCTLTSESMPAFIIHPPSHLDVSDQLFSSHTSKTEIDTQQKTFKEYKDCKEDVQEASTQESHELIDQDEITQALTARIGFQDKCGPEMEQESRLDYIYNKNHDEVIEERRELQIVQSTTEASAMQGAVEAEFYGGTEVLTGQAEQQIHHLASLKPAVPVNQECGPEECTSAPPFSEPVKVSLADSRMETLSHLEICLHPLAPQQSSGEITILEDTARCKYQTNFDNRHAEREEHTSGEVTVDIDTFLARTQDSESQEHSSGKISTAHTAEETFRYASHKQGEVTVTKVKTDNITHRNWVEISESTPENRRENEDIADVNAVPDQLLSRSLIPGER
ncbi:hypothetical protein M9458_038300, partial [Cirrhinus mrigala]